MVQKIVPILAVFLMCAVFSSALAQEESVPAAFRSTEYPLPRFVSLGSDEAYVRSGPGRKYPILWVYKQRAIPVEIVLEFDVWRKIQDFDGQTGWIHKTLLNGTRTGFVNTDELTGLYKKPRKDSPVTAYLEPKLLVSVNACENGWCEVTAREYTGWLEQSVIWGVYEGENFN